MNDFDFGNGIFIDTSIQGRIRSELRNEDRWTPPNINWGFKNTARFAFSNDTVRCPFYEREVNIKDQCYNCPSFGENFSNEGIDCLSKTSLRERKEKLEK